MSERPTIPIVRRLCAELDEEAIRYCHLKSRPFLERSRIGESDLDLLVARSGSSAFSAVVHRLSFKQAWRPSRAQPGILSYYGYDEEADRLLHVHAHYHLVAGDELTNTYRLPIEDAFLDAATYDGEFRVPRPELEFIVLVIHLVLKHAAWEALATRREGLPAKDRARLAFLEARIDRDEVDRLLAQELPYVDRWVFWDAVGALAPDARLLERIMAAQRLTTGLAPCARRSRASDVSLKLWRRGSGVVRRRAGAARVGKQLLEGGAVIAIVGADGAGKSTAVEGLSSWLSPCFSVRKIHLGKPPRSSPTVALRTVVKGGSAASRAVRRRAAHAPAPSGTGAARRAVLAVGLARDRYLTSMRARRHAANGDLVICDRFPVPQLTQMDAPRIDRANGGRPAGPLMKRLSMLEQKYYCRIPGPDILVVLRVDPEVAVARKPEEPPDFVRARWREIWEADWHAAAAHVVDAGQPRNDVLTELKSLVWSAI